MDKEKTILLQLTNKQVESWIVGNNSDDGLLNDQMDIFRPILRIRGDDDSYYENPIVIFGTPFAAYNNIREEIWVVKVTIYPVEE
tara:strand:+ start:347 stop:601 length:255 start_codon:yes stop_codon:yes gene_type:complete